jgi:polyisoprenoid-binding protein YceI
MLRHDHSNTSPRSACRRLALSLGLALTVGQMALSQAAEAASWRLDQARSALTFAYTEAGRPQDGRFTTLSAEGVFDLDQPGETRLVMTVDVDSIDLGDILKSAFALKEDWFDASAYPTAVFTLTNLRPVGPQTYAATGELQIKGASQSVAAEVRITPMGDRIRVAGQMPLNRRAFGVGVGFTDRLMKLSDVVQLAFELEAAPLTQETAQ